MGVTVGKPRIGPDGFVPRRFAGNGNAAPPRLALRERDVLELLPALAHSRDRALQLLAGHPVSSHELVATVESDAALTLTLLATAARRAGRAGGASVPRAVERLARGELVSAFSRIPVFDLFDRTRAENAQLELFRLHALATQRAADYIQRHTGIGDRDHVLVAALLHDLGKLVLRNAYDSYGELLRLPATPDQRVRLEQRQFGIDHAAAGAHVLRELGLPGGLVSAIERHHSEHAGSEAAIVRLADTLAHYAGGDPVDLRPVAHAGRALGLDQDAIRGLFYMAPNPGEQRRQVERSPLTPRQTEILRCLRDGKLYKQIAAEMRVSPSTIRSHLHVMYKKLDVVDRAQAVLVAAERGWIA